MKLTHFVFSRRSQWAIRARLNNCQQPRIGQLDQPFPHAKKIVDEAPGDGLETVVDFYLSSRHYDHPARSCLLAALGSELSRQPSAVKEAVTVGQRKFLDFLSGIAPGKTKALRRKQALLTVAAIVGAMTLARGTSDPQLCQEILDTIAQSVPNSVRAAS